MKVLLDTNILLHREAANPINCDIGNLFYYLDKEKYIKCVHSISIQEIKKYKDKKTVNSLMIKLNSYEILKISSIINPIVKEKCDTVDININDYNDTKLLNELFVNRVDLLITEDKKIHKKAKLLNIDDKVFSINSFLEKLVSEHPELINYKVLSVKKESFGHININDSFFDSFKEDYIDFEKWFIKKTDEIAYITFNKNQILSFLYLKIENNDENYSNITPQLQPKKRLKIGTFKVIHNGFRLGERFLKIIFDNALQYKVEEIYVTIFNKRKEQQRLIDLLVEWGFKYFGIKTTINGEEKVYIKDFKKNYNVLNPKLSFPFISTKRNTYLCPIYPEYHTNLLPDSILTTESPENFSESYPHRNAIRKVYVSRSIERDIKTGDIIIFYRTASGRGPGYHTSVITTIAITEKIIKNITNKEEFILKCKKRSIFTDNELIAQWEYNPKYRPFIIYFLCSYSFKKRINRHKLLDLNILTGDKNEIRGLKKISQEQFLTILKETETNENIIVN